MVNEVESILNEIRERARTGEKQRETAVAVATQNGNDSNPAISPTAPAIATESLARLEAHLTTTSRAWDRLPPLVSNRSGVAARFELWIKARLKSLSRWFTWEQVNFNSAAHHGLSDALEALRAHEEQMIRMQAELNQAKEALREADLTKQALSQTTEALRAESRQTTESLRVESRQTTESLRVESRQLTESLRVESRQLTESLRVESRQRTETLQAELAHTAEELRAERSQANEALASELRQTTASLRADLGQTSEDLRATFDARAAEMNTRVSELSDDLHEEQRVCFKQLSLETSEAAVLEDRGRRAIEARLEKLEQIWNAPAERSGDGALDAQRTEDQS
jgi:DNA repair exonuclease SbcCD ATPase subunit